MTASRRAAGAGPFTGVAGVIGNITITDRDGLGGQPRTNQVHELARERARASLTRADGARVP
jgi:hypothetical protein